MLPESSFAFFRQEIRTVCDDGTIQVKDSYYAALPAPLHTLVIVRIYDNEIEIIDPATLTIIRRHPKSQRRGSVFMDEKDRIFNPSRQTNYLFARAAEIGPNTKAWCKLVFEDQGRPGQRRLQGIVNLVRRYEAVHIEAAAAIAVNKNLLTYRVIRRLVEDLASKQQTTVAGDGQSSICQSHPLIRAPQDYAAFFERHASGQSSQTRH